MVRGPGRILNEIDHTHSPGTERCVVDPARLSCEGLPFYWDAVVSVVASGQGALLEFGSCLLALNPIGIRFSSFVLEIMSTRSTS